VKKKQPAVLPALLVLLFPEDGPEAPADTGVCDRAVAKQARVDIGELGDRCHGTDARDHLPPADLDRQSVELPPYRRILFQCSSRAGPLGQGTHHTDGA